MFSSGNRTNTASYGFGTQRTPKSLDEPTQKLFKAIDDENLEDFEQALAKDADVNAFDNGYTPLMTIVSNLSTCSEAETEKKYHGMIRLLLLHKNIKVNICERINDNTVLHLAMCFQQKKTLQLLLSHPDINTNVTNKSHQNPKRYAEQNRAEHLIVEIQKAQKGKQLLTAFSRSIYLAKMLLNQELNPNCWRRNQNGEIKTPLSLIIELCSEEITEDKQEILTKLLKHKELDFGQIKPIQAIEKNQRLKRIIVQAITERLTDAINRKDLNDVKELLEDNCFMDHAIVTAARRNVKDPTESIQKYLNEKFPANTLQPSAGTNNVPVYEYLKQEKVDRQARTGALVSQEMTDQPPLENERFRTKGLDNINQRSLKVSAPGRNYASAFFVLPGAFAVGACLAIEGYPVISACLITIALGFLLVGYFLYKGGEKDRGPSGIADNPQVTRVLIFSLNPAENSYTY